MNAGKLRHVVTIQSPTKAANTRGAETITWSTLATVRAEVRSLNGRELAANDQITATATHQVTLRYRSDITTKHRIKWGARYFGITSVMENDNRMRSLVLQCTELVGQDRVL